jgi:hypothetical protein
MATTEQKKPQAKTKAKKPAGKKPAVKESRPEARKTAPAKDPTPVKAPAPAQVTEAPAVLVNAVKPEEKLPETAVVQAMDSFEKSLKAAVPAAVAVNSKLVDIAQANMNAGMELARDLAGAKTPMEFMRLGMTYWQENMGVFQAQAAELRTLQAAFVATASQPMREHIRRS